MATKKTRKKRNPSMAGISRIDQPEKHNHGWFVRLTRHGKRYSAFFSDKKNGGKTTALAKAKVAYQKLVKSHPHMSRKEFAQIERRSNKTGIVGVTKLIKEVRGRKYKFWQATWSPEPGAVRKKAFSVTRYGDDKAKKMAVNARKKGLTEMKD
jgi:hypothetical protein